MRIGLKQTLFAAATVAIIVLLVGCPTDTEEDPVSITARVQQLQSDLNGNYTGVYLNWHPDSSTRQLGANPTGFETTFPESETYAISSITVVSESGDVGTATAVFTSTPTTAFSNAAADFDMRKSGDDWFIDRLVITANSVDLANIYD